MKVPALRWGAAIVVLLVGLGWALSSWRRPMQRVALRLDASFFTGDGDHSREPVAKIGAEARAVVAEPERISIFEGRKLSSEEIASGLPITLPDATVDLPDSAFVLKTIQLARGAKGVGAFVEAWLGEWVPVDRGWSLVRDRSDARSAVLRITDADVTETSPIILDAFRPAPMVLDSRPFDLPYGASIELGYGLAGRERASDGARVEFIAALLCLGSPPAVLFRATVDTRNPAHAGWHDASASPAGRRRACRLRLRFQTDAENPGGPVWAVPRVVAPVGRSESFDPRSLVLISLDTLRANHLSGYGYARETSPAIDRLLIARGTTFIDTITTYPLTQIAHMGLFTGLYPTAFGKNPGVLPPKATIRTLAEALRDAGFETAAFTEDVLVSGDRGFWYGYDEFTEPAGMGRARETFADGMRYIREHRDRKFFLFLHTYQTHSPYRPSRDYRALFERDGLDMEHIPAKYRGSLDKYDREIRETDDVVADFVTELDRLGLDARTYVVLLSDHGEAFGEHGQIGHGLGPYEEQLRVPLVIRGPGIPAGRRITAPVSLIDITPTLLELLGVPPLAQTHGVSLYDVLHQGARLPARPLHFEWMAGGHRRGVRYDRWKFLEHPKGRGPGILLDLVDDPAERSPIQGPHPARERGQQLLAAYETDGARLAQALGTADVEVNPHVLSRQLGDALRALGHIQ